MRHPQKEGALVERIQRHNHRQLSRELFATWAQTWGLSLGFAITQSVDEAEKIVSDAIVALVARKSASPRTIPLEDAETDFEPTDFAATIWQLASPKAFRGFGADSFFKLSVLTRAVVMLKLRARFSRGQIAEALDLPIDQIESHLESARLVHSGGRNWLVSPALNEVDGFATCPQWERVYQIPQHYVWKAKQKIDGQKVQEKNADAVVRAEFLQEIFDRYVGNDLDDKTTKALHCHLSDCTTCRKGFVHFRKTYNDWVTTIPTVEADAALQKHLDGVSKQATRQLAGNPTAWLAFKQSLRNPQLRAILVLLAAGLIYVYFKN